MRKASWPGTTGVNWGLKKVNNIKVLWDDREENMKKIKKKIGENSTNMFENI